METNAAVDRRLLKQIQAAAGRVYRLVRRTPLVRCTSLSEHYGADIWLKQEQRQPYVRAYKGRGVANFFYSQPARPSALVTASGGNHGRAVARLAAVERVPATIFVPQAASTFTVGQIRRLGSPYVEVVRSGEIFDDAYAAAWAYAGETGSLMVPPYDHPAIIAGQGTLGLEVAAQLTALDLVPEVALCQIGGGGVFSGYGTAMKAVFPSLHLIGVELDEAAAMTASLEAGERRTVSVPSAPFSPTMAVACPGELTFLYVQALADQMVVTDRPATCRAMETLAQAHPGFPAEPAGATGVAALEQLVDQIAGRTVVCLITGGNFDRAMWPRIRDWAARA